MTVTTVERFRVPRSSPFFAGLLGLAFAGFGVFFAWSGFRREVIDLFMVYFGGFSALIGAILLGAAKARMGREVSVGPDGVQFTGGGELVPWGTTGGLKGSWTGELLYVLDPSGRTLGSIPTSLHDFPRALLLLASGVGAGTPVTTRVFKGGHGWSGAVLLLLPILYVCFHVSFGRLASLEWRAWLGAGMLLVVALFQLRLVWSRTGSTEVTIDRQGIGFQGRAGDWQANWGEIEFSSLTAKNLRSTDAFCIDLFTMDGEWRSLPLAGLDLLGILNAIRTNGATTWEKLLAPPIDANSVRRALRERDELPLSRK